MEPQLEEKARRNQSRFVRWLGQFGLSFAGSFMAMVLLGLGALFLLGDESLGGRTDAEAWVPAYGCNVVGIAVRGPISVSGYGYAEEECMDGCPAETISDEVIEYIHAASEDDAIKAILLDIDSGGGEPVASEEIATALAAAGKPSVAWVRQYATSGAYWIASAADTIVASANSDVGGIGVTMSYLDNVALNEQEGLRFNSLSSGKYKDSGSPDKELTDDEAALFARDLAIMHANFIAAVAQNRELSIEQVTALSDGSTMLGRMALENGLIDTVGGQAEAYAALVEAVGEEPEICWAGI